MIDRKKLEELQARATQRVEQANEKVNGMFRQPVPPHVQLATYKALSMNPQKMAEYKARVGDQKWAEYETAMQELDRTLGAGAWSNG